MKLCKQEKYNHIDKTIISSDIWIWCSDCISWVGYISKDKKNCKENLITHAVVLLLVLML